MTTDTDQALAHIREAYARPPGIFGHYSAEGRGREFDAVIARVRRDAWNEGAQAQADTYGGQIDAGPNPYEETP